MQPVSGVLIYEYLLWPTQAYTQTYMHVASRHSVNSEGFSKWVSNFKGASEVFEFDFFINYETTTFENH